MAKSKLGLIHIYSGDGKGKTTACVGLAVRAAGRGLRVWFVQFLKSGKSAEIEMLEKLGVHTVSGQPTNKFTFAMTPAELAAAKEFNTGRLQEAIAAARAGEMDLLILDEVMGSIASGILEEQDILDFLKSKPEHLEVAMSGRDPSPALQEIADYHTECMMRKHPYETSGLGGRAGIEF
ncbi:MAG: cob(I)yrinic acid a,c-diamide adenosyltransferase [Saccharofermentanales bacterium]|nr:cob(I)yrinic acid a,c-diamide adenosyltransferase [Bacillota bacterium]